MNPYQSPNSGWKVDVDDEKGQLAAYCRELISIREREKAGELLPPRLWTYYVKVAAIPLLFAPVAIAASGMSPLGAPALLLEGCAIGVAYRDIYWVRSLWKQWFEQWRLTQQVLDWVKISEIVADARKSNDD